MEPFGLVALEAMACGTPVIGVHEGGVRESVVEGVSGILVERGSPEIAAAIERLMGDPALRSSLGKSARDYVCRGWTWEATIDRYEDCVRRVLAKEQGASDRTGELGSLSPRATTTTLVGDFRKRWRVERWCLWAGVEVKRPWRVRSTIGAKSSHVTMKM